MKFAVAEDQFNPILYHLQKRNLPELIRIMFNRKLSEEYLERYGQKIDPPLKKTQESRLQDYMRRFNAMEIVHLKGSHPDHDIKYHVNTFLEEYFKRKLRKEGLFTPEDRKQAWLQLTSYYQTPQLFEALDELQLAPSIFQDIKKDVDRTYLSEDLKIHLITQQEKKARQAQNRVKLTKILENFVKYNPFVAYCQGMNILVQFFLQQGFSQQQSFFLLKKITEELLPCDYHSTMNSITALLLLLCEVIAHTHSQAVKQIKYIVWNNGGEGISYVLSFAFQWFVCLFTNSNIKRDIRRCIFDHYMLYGLPILLKASLCFFDVIEPGILNTKQFQQFNPLVQKIIRQFNDLQHLKHRLNETYINKNLMQLLLNKLIKPPEKRKKRQCKTMCDRRWTMCIQTIENNIVNGYSHDFFVFKTLSETKVIQNYLEEKSKNKNYFCIRKQKSKIDHLLLGRMEHCCRPLSGTSQTQDLESNKCSLAISAQKYNSQSPRSKKSDFSKVIDLEQPEKKELIRNKALQQLYSQSNTQRQSMMMRSQSIQFMRHMIQNESFTNLLQILEVQNMNDLFKDCISQVDQDEENNL